MFHRTLEDVAAAGRFVSLHDQNVRSARIIVAADRVGFSLSDVQTLRDNDATIWYRNHWEANYVVAGEGELTELTGGRTWPLQAGMLFVVGPNDHHRVRAAAGTHLLSVFCPPLEGDEQHDREGAYTASAPAAATDRRMLVRRYDDLLREGKGVRLPISGSTTVRMLVKEDGAGFSLSDARTPAGSDHSQQYRHHWEANYIVSGTGDVTDLGSGQSWRLEPGVTYVVGPKDHHRVRFDTDVHLISVFCPPLRGDEVHGPDGSFPPTGPVPPGPPDG